MKIINPFKIYLIDIKSFLIFIIVIQILMFGLISINYLNNSLSIFRIFIGLIYLLVIPGLCILRAMKIQYLSNTEVILITIGLSLTSDMFVGFIINLLFPLFGDKFPFSIQNIIFCLGGIIFLLCLISYYNRNIGFSEKFPEWEFKVSRFTTLIFFIPLLAIFGTYLVNYYMNNILLLILIVTIIILVGYAGIKNDISSEYYPIIIFISIFSLIYHTSLISNYLPGWDIISEYYYSNLVLTNQIWDQQIFSVYNSVLSTNMLSPIFSLILNLNLTEVYKIIFPGLFAIVPIGLYSLFTKFFSPKVSFLSTFFFILIFPTYTMITQTIRQLFAEIFLIILLILIFNTKININKKNFLIIIFTAAIIVSHYGTAYLILGSMIFVYIYSKINFNFHIKNKIFDEIKYKISDNSINITISIVYLLFFTFFTIIWYFFSSNISAFASIIQIGSEISDLALKQFLSPESSRGMALLSSGSIDILHLVNKYFYIISQILIFIGLIFLFFKKDKINRTFFGFSLYWFLILVFAIALPNFAAMGPTRLFHLSLFFLAPICVLGGFFLFAIIKQICPNNISSKISYRLQLKVLLVYFIIFFLFSSGFIFEITNDHPTSFSLSQNNIKTSNEIKDRIPLEIYILPESDVFSAKWLSINMNNQQKIYLTKGNGEGMQSLTYSMISDSLIIQLHESTKIFHKNSYIYISLLNYKEYIGIDFNEQLGAPMFFDMKKMHPILNEQHKIYMNSDSIILLT